MVNGTSLHLSANSDTCTIELKNWIDALRTKPTNSKKLLLLISLLLEKATHVHFSYSLPKVFIYLLSTL